MAHVKIQYDVMDAFCMDVFQRFGFTKEESRIISDVLLLSDVYGIESHGAQRLVRYHKGIASGMIKVHAKPEIVFETPVSAVVDGHDGMGQLIGHFAMDLAIKKAKEIGMAIVTVRDSNHFGIAGYYAKMACDQGLIGMAFTNSEAIVVPTFGKKAMLGTNPIAISMPDLNVVCCPRRCLGLIWSAWALKCTIFIHRENAWVLLLLRGHTTWC